MRRTERSRNEFVIAMERLNGAVQSLGGGDRANFDTLLDVLDYDLSLPDIVCDRTRSFSQHGEDIILAALLRAKGIEPADGPLILELGSNHPVNMNNTWLLYKLGFRSVLVDANSRYAADTAKARPHDTFLCAGVTAENRRNSILYVPQHAELASFSLAFVTSWYERRGLTADIKEVDVPLRHINDILAEYFGDSSPAILGIDLEGLDFDILQSLDWARWKPSIICIERFRRNRSHALVVRFLKDLGYELVAATQVNDIFRI